MLGIISIIVAASRSNFPVGKRYGCTISSRNALPWIVLGFFPTPGVTISAAISVADRIPNMIFALPGSFKLNQSGPSGKLCSSWVFNLNQWAP